MQTGLPLRLGWRELRGGVRGLSVFLGCVALGVGTIAAIGSLAAALAAGISGNARELLGGDVEVRLAYRSADAAERAFLRQSGTVSQIATLRAMARSPDGAKHSLVELKAVDTAYPLCGRLALSPGQPPAQAFVRRDGAFGAAADPALLARLGLRIGDRMRIGEAMFAVRAAIEREPDLVPGALILGPRVMISATGLAATRLLQPGALVAYHYRLKLPAGVDAAGWARAAEAAFPNSGWRIRTYDRATQGLERLLRRVGLYLTLVGLAALLVGGVGIGNAVGFHLAGKTATIATLRCLGGAPGLVFATYVAEIAMVGMAGIVAGLVLGAVTPAIVMPFLSGVLPVEARFTIYPRPLAVAALYGVLTTCLFSLPALAGVLRIGPGALFRSLVDRARPGAPAWAWGMTVALAAGLALLVLACSEDRAVALWFVAGAAVALALFRGAGGAIAFAAARLGRPRHPLARLALANLHRPGAATVPTVLSLGLGLGVLVTIALVEGNLAREIDTRLPSAAPAFFFIDIQPDQLAGFESLVRATPGARLEQVPMLRGRITRLDGVPVDEAKVAPGARWALRSDRGLTYSASLPEGSRLVAGAWWPAHYDGPPLVSFDAELAHGMGLKVGDTLSVNLLGREITARIANLREIDWQRLGINFAMVFAPGTLESAPQTRLAAVWLPAGEEEALVRRIGERFPNVSAVHVRDALEAVGRILGLIARAVGIAALAIVAAGMLVLGGTVAAGHRRRVYDAVVLKVLGATRGRIIGAVLIEYGLLGAVAAVCAGVVGSLAARLLVTRSLRLDWVLLWRPLGLTIVSATVAALTLGLVGAWRALAARPGAYLRNE